MLRDVARGHRRSATVAAMIDEKKNCHLKLRRQNSDFSALFPEQYGCGGFGESVIALFEEIARGCNSTQLQSVDTRPMAIYLCGNEEQKQNIYAHLRENYSPLLHSPSPTPAPMRLR